MGKKVKLLIIAASVVAALALSVGFVVATASPNSAKENGICCGQVANIGGQGVCSDAVCELLGLTPEEIQVQRHEGNSLVQIAITQGVSEQQLVEAILVDSEAEIQARVTAGTLTQEQANIILQQIEQNVVSSVNRTSVGQPDWAGTKGKGNGQSGQATGSGQIRQQGRYIRGSSYGEPGLGTGPGNMHKWGKGSR